MNGRGLASVGAAVAAAIGTTGLCNAAGVGGAERDRTADLLIANEALSQLSYGPNRGRRQFCRPVSMGDVRRGVGRVKNRPVQGRFGGLFGRDRPASFAAVPPRIAMRALLDVILIVLDLYVWLLIAAAILSWLVAFNVVNSRNQVVAMVGDFLYRVTEPVLRPIRNMLPSLGGIDVSPVVVILIIILIKDIIVRYIYPSVF
jgi:YggT family protein